MIFRTNINQIQPVLPPQDFAGNKIVVREQIEAPVAQTDLLEIPAIP